MFLFAFKKHTDVVRLHAKIAPLLICFRSVCGYVFPDSLAYRYLQIKTVICACPHGLDNFYKKIGVNALFLI